MKTLRRLPVLVLLALLASGSTAPAKVPPLQEVPDYLTDNVKKDLTSQREALQKRLAALRKEADDYNTNCAGRDLPADALQTKECLAQKARLDKAVQDYTQAALAFNAEVLTFTIPIAATVTLPANTPRSMTNGPQGGVTEDLVREILFPGKPSGFPKNPNPPLLNPLIEAAMAKNLPVPGETADAFTARFLKSGLYKELDPSQKMSFSLGNGGPPYPRGKYPGVDKIVDENMNGIDERETAGIGGACRNAVEQMNAAYADMERQGIIRPGDDLAAKEKTDVVFENALMQARHRVFEQFKKDIRTTLTQRDNDLDKLRLVVIPQLQEASKSDVEKYLFPANQPQ